MPVSNISKKVTSEKIPVIDPVTGLEQPEKEDIQQALDILAAEKRMEAEALPENLKKMILQEIKIDDFNTIRRYVELTPSMCDLRGCGWDAAKEMGASDWNNLPLDQELPGGKTFAQKAQEMLRYHKRKAHTYADQNDHIISEEELRQKQWGPGQQVYLTGAQ